jgi:hypothetical protein
VAVYLDGGPCADEVPSTIVDLTGSVPRLLRRGVIPVERLREVIPLALEDEASGDEESGDEPPVDEAPGDGPRGDGIPGPGDSQETGKAVPEGPAETVPEDTGRPREVFHGLEEAADQGNQTDPDATG